MIMKQGRIVTVVPLVNNNATSPAAAVHSALFRQTTDGEIGICAPPVMDYSLCNY